MFVPSTEPFLIDVRELINLFSIIGVERERERERFINSDRIHVPMVATVHAIKFTAYKS